MVEFGTVGLQRGTGEVRACVSTSALCQGGIRMRIAHLCVCSLPQLGLVEALV